MADTSTIGGNGKDGELHVRDAKGERLLDVAVGTHKLRHDAEVIVGGAGRDGLLRVAQAATGGPTTSISNTGMSLYGHLSIHAKDNRNPLNVNPFGDEMRVLMGDTGVAAYLQLSSGSNGPGPVIEISGKDNAFRMGDPGKSTSKIEIVGTQGRVTAGGEGVNGRFVANAADGTPRVTASGSDASVRVGGNGANGTVSVVGADGQPLLELLGRANECVMGLGQSNRPARISLYDGRRGEAIKLDAASGDIHLANADAAEFFDVEGLAEPGSVMVVSDAGTLVQAEKAYDSRVAGVVSGAGSFRPGLVLDHRETRHERAPIALMGKVFCKVDAREHPVRAGDLLTTSGTAGHAMRVTDRARALGAVVGKALTSLDDGVGLVPVLVTLQ